MREIIKSFQNEADVDAYFAGKSPSEEFSLHCMLLAMEAGAAKQTIHPYLCKVLAPHLLSKSKEDFFIRLIAAQKKLCDLSKDADLYAFQLLIQSLIKSDASMPSLTLEVLYKGILFPQGKDDPQRDLALHAVRDILPEEKQEEWDAILSR